MLFALENDQEFLDLQVEMVRLQDSIRKTGKRLLIIFEGRDAAGTPSWFRSSIKAPAGAISAWLDLSSMSSGLVVVGDRPLGRYLASSGGRSIGPSRLPLPMERIAGATTSLMIFDEEGRSPADVRIVDTP